MGYTPQTEEVATSLTPMNIVQPLLGYLVGGIFGLLITFWQIIPLLSNPILYFSLLIINILIGWAIIAGKIENYRVWRPVIQTHNLFVQTQKEPIDEKQTNNNFNRASRFKEPNDQFQNTYVDLYSGADFNRSVYDY